jgi:hypothetical protein
MLTPLFYTNLAIKLQRYKSYWILCFIAGILLCLLSAFFMKTIPNAFSIFGIGLLFIIWGWGLFLICQWFNPSSSIIGDSHGNSRKDEMLILFRTGKRWYESIFLTIWFLSTLFVLLFIFRTLK